MNEYPQLGHVSNNPVSPSYPKKKKWLPIIIVVVLLILALGYIGYNSFVNYQQTILQTGYAIGVNQTMINLMEWAPTCEYLPLDYGNNQSLHLIAAECLQQGAQNG